MADRRDFEADAPEHDEEGAGRGDRPKSDDGDRGSKPGLLKRYPVIRYVLIVALVAGVVAGAAWYLNYRERGQYRQSTNNAYVRADFVTVSPKLGGYVDRVLVRENQPVTRGQLLAVLDSRDYRASVAQAQAQVASAVAGIRTARSTLDEQRAVIAQSAAQVSAAEVAAEAAAAEVRRYEPLARSGRSRASGWRPWYSSAIARSSTCAPNAPPIWRQGAG